VKRPTTRRDFLKTSTLGLAGFGIWVHGPSLFGESKSPNEKLNIGVIGSGGKGRGDMDNAARTENIVAICDVDERSLEKAYETYPGAARYKDFRKMLEKEKSIDAVTVSTSDHMHAPASVMAMKLGKHVYCQKPLTHSVYEARVMRQVARERKVATQMGNQGSAEDGFRRGVEVIQSGAIGAVREVHVWSNRPIWDQGMDKPLPAQEVPEYLDWDLWIGAAPMRPYNEGYHPFKWRGWWDFGTGALGDMACHTANLPFRALKLEYPTRIEAESSGVNQQSAPKWSRIKFDFPARGELPALKFFWYDGGEKPPATLTEGMDLASVTGGRRRRRIEVLQPGQVPGSGCLLIGDKGALFSPDDYGSAFKLFPAEEFADYKAPDPTIPRNQYGGGDGGHNQEWIQACKGGPAGYSNFDYAALLTETILLGNLALRCGHPLEWDGPNMKAKNCKGVDRFIRREYREGWTQ
jgi:hypothetical protein